ncbi:50S ribosomal protein L35 [Candidatus Peribacteria bacterium]|nr:50S ribosomal protein L35 [Candidatus Peribacteria bacterium]
MPKMKTKSAAAKRVKSTKSGFKIAAANRHHLLSSKTNRQNRTRRKGLQAAPKTHTSLLKAVTLS